MIESLEVNFTCPRCGRPNGSSDARLRTVRCACGQTLTVGSSAPAASLRSAPLRPPPLPPRAESPRAAYDPVAAHHGLLIQERQARALEAPQPFLVPEVDDPGPRAADAAPATPRPPEQPAGGEPRRGDVPRPRTAAGARWGRRAAVAVAALLAAGAASWLVATRGPVRLAVLDLLERVRGGAPGPGAAEVAAALQASARPLRACVRAAERGPPRFRLAGRRVVLRATVTPSGRVTAPRLEDAELDRSPPGACLKSAARRMVFPPHDGDPVEVRIPLALDGSG
jgi:hypothetical protein